METILTFNQPPKSNGKYNDLLNKVTKKEPKNNEEQKEVLNLLNDLINDGEITYEEKMSYIFAFSNEVMSHSYGLFPKNSRSEGL